MTIVLYLQIAHGDSLAAMCGVQIVVRVAHAMALMTQVCHQQHLSAPV
jgi:hypothetical protein